ncbi:hypothetical protein ACWGCW_25060 [Streptomyces sp. NPDC054933]
MVLTDSGAKLSKTLIRQSGTAAWPGTEPWMLDATSWEGPLDRYVGTLVWLASAMLSEPKHFERGYTTRELGRLIAKRPG